VVAAERGAASVPGSEAEDRSQYPPALLARCRVSGVLFAWLGGARARRGTPASPSSSHPPSDPGAKTTPQWSPSMSSCRSAYPVDRSGRGLSSS